MIDDPKPKNWKTLQTGVCRLFNDVGITAEVERKIQTAKSHITVDVYGVDLTSVDQIVYIVECKNWNSGIPQTVVHGFTTVMHDTGANIGFIISKKGLQSGAEENTNYTNITGLTYLELQQRYFKVWWTKYFSEQFFKAVFPVVQYLEELNMYRDRRLQELDDQTIGKVSALQAQYHNLLYLGFLVRGGNFFSEKIAPVPNDFQEFKTKLEDLLDLSLKSVTYRELLNELCTMLKQVEDQFNALFGGNIFNWQD